jgi:hypothetical protein
MRHKNHRSHRRRRCACVGCVVTIVGSALLLGYKPSHRAPQALRNTLHTPPKSLSNLSLAVSLVEPRCAPGMRIALASALRHLPDHAKIYLWHAKSNQRYANAVARQLSNAGRISTQLLPLEPPSEQESGVALYTPTNWYSRLMLKPEFWRAMSADWILVLQSDTVVCSPPPLDAFRYPYVGGISGFVTLGYWSSDILPDNFLSLAFPLHVGAAPAAREMARSHLNGGASLHDTSWTLACLDAVGWGIEDDVYNACRSPVPESTAYAFASDNGNTACFTDADGRRVCPAILHKPWSHASKESLHELEHSCPAVVELRRVSRESALCAESPDVSAVP